MHPIQYLRVAKTRPKNHRSTAFPKTLAWPHQRQTRGRRSQVLHERSLRLPSPIRIPRESRYFSRQLKREEDIIGFHTSSLRIWNPKWTKRLRRYSRKVRSPQKCTITRSTLGTA